MMPLKILIATIFLLSISLNSDSFLIMDLISLVTTVQDQVEKYQDKYDKDIVFERFLKLQSKLITLTNHQDQLFRDSRAILEMFPENMRLELKLNDFINYIADIDIQHRRMKEYGEYMDTLEEFTLKDFAQSVVTHHGNSVLNLMEKIHEYVIPHKHGFIRIGLFQLLENAFTQLGSSRMCQAQQSPRQILFNFYDLIAVTQLKGYLLVRFSYQILRLYSEGNFSLEVYLMESRYLNRMNSMIQTIRKPLSRASQELWMCDPPEYIYGKTYLQIFGLAQGYIIGNIELVAIESSQSSQSGCNEFYENSKVKRFTEDRYHDKKECKSMIRECQDISNNQIVICESDTKTTRYENVQLINESSYGKSDFCDHEPAVIETIAVIGNKNIFCLCLCIDEDTDASNRYFSTDPVFADISKNMVVTGLRMVEKDRRIYVQVQEGKLLPTGVIDHSTVHWIPVKKGVNYYTVKWSQRQINLDDVVNVQQGYVVTGIQFHYLQGFLHLKIRTNYFDFNSGKVFQNKTSWIFNAHSRRTQVNFSDYDVPIYSTLPSLPDSKDKYYFEFTHVSFKLDVAQTAIPFIETQAVESKIPVPLKGAGIYHKGVEGFAGFMALKLITYDFSKHIESFCEI